MSCTCCSPWQYSVAVLHNSDTTCILIYNSLKKISIVEEHFDKLILQLPFIKKKNNMFILVFLIVTVFFARCIFDIM